MLCTAYGLDFQYIYLSSFMYTLLPIYMSAESVILSLFCMLIMFIYELLDDCTDILIYLRNCLFFCLLLRDLYRMNVMLMIIYMTMYEKKKYNFLFLPVHGDEIKVIQLKTSSSLKSSFFWVDIFYESS